MVEVIGVRFRQNGKIYFFAPNSIALEVGDAVIVETARGVEYGKVVLGKREIEEGNITSTLKPVIRKATAEDDKKNGHLTSGRTYLSLNPKITRVQVVSFNGAGFP